MKNLSNLKVENLKISELKEWDKNPREITQENYERLKRDIQKYSLLSPLLVDGRDKRTVLGGNMRLRALKELQKENKKIDTVTCVIIDIKDNEEAIKVAIKDNEQFGKYVESKLLELTEGIPDIQESEITLSSTKIEDIVDWSDFTSEDGTEKELLEHLKSSDENIIYKIVTTKENAKELESIIQKEVERTGEIDKGKVLLELIKNKK